MAYWYPNSANVRGGARERGRDTGRGAMRRLGPRPRQVSSYNEPSLPMPDLSQRMLRTITASSPRAIDNENSRLPLGISNVTYVASYNWIGKNSETILVPGKPPKWQPPVGQTQKLREDNGSYYRDPNAARHPSYPTEPAIRAIYELNETFESSHIDLFGCGSTFGSLLSFARRESRTFRFGVERIGDTVFLVRKTNTPKELIENVYGFGHSFPETYTNWEPEVKGSESHQRIITYNFAGLRCLVRSECDGYISNVKARKSNSKTAMASTNTVSGSENSAVHTKRTHTAGPSADDGSILANILSDTSVTTTIDRSQTQHPSENKHKLVLQRSSARSSDPVAQSWIFDLKTRSIKRKDAILQNMSGEFLHRLWINQTPNFILAWHEHGTFTSENIDIRDARDEITAWESENQTTLQHYRDVLAQLIELSKETDRFEVRRTALGDLEIWSEIDGWSVLPKDLKKRWKNGDKAGGGLDDDDDDRGGGAQIDAHDEEDENGIDDYLKF